MNELSLEDLIAPLKAQWALIVTITIVISVLAVLYVSFFVPTDWQARTSIVFEESGGSELEALRQLGGLGSAVSGSASKGKFLMLLLESRAVRGRAVDSLGLAEGTDVQARNRAMGRIADSYQAELPVAGVLVLETTWQGEPRGRRGAQSRDAAEMAARVAQELVASLQEELSQFDYTEASRRRIMLAEQLHEATEELNRAEDELVSYATREGLVSVPDQASESVSELGALRRQEADLLAELRGAEAREAQARQRLGDHERMAVSSIVEKSDPAIDRLTARILDLEQQITEQRDVQGKSDQHPDVASLVSELETVTAQLDALIPEDLKVDTRSLTTDPSYASLLADSISQGQQISAMRASIAAIQGQKQALLRDIEQFPVRSVSYARLRREVDMRAEAVGRLAESYDLARISEASSATTFRIIDEAEVPTGPSGPSLKTTAALSIFLSLMLSSVIAFWVHGRRNSESGDEPV